MSSHTEALLDDKTPIKYLLIGDSSTNKIITEFSAENFQPNKNKSIKYLINYVKLQIKI
jgi:hypothetical protein